MPAGVRLIVTNRSFHYALPYLWNKLPLDFWQPHFLDESPPPSPFSVDVISSFHLHLFYCPLLYHSFIQNSQLTCFINLFYLSLFLYPPDWFHGFLVGMWRIPNVHPNQTESVTFYPRDAMRRAGLCDSNVSECLSVCPSVRLSVTAGIVSKRKQLASWFLQHLIAPWFHSQARYDLSKNSQGSPPARAICENGVGSNGRFLRFFHL